VNPAPLQRLPVSVSMIAGAEAERIGRTLQSVADWTSEIVVVLNQEVADGTEEIARQYGATVYREAWKGHRAQKNSAAQKATAEWVLGLDADEVVSEALRAEVQRLFEEPARLGGYAAFSFPRLSWFCGRWIRHGDWYPDRSPRLWRRGLAEWGGVDPHDRLLVKGKIGRLQGDLHHYSGEAINDRLRKLVRFSDEFVRQYQGKGRVPGVGALVARPVWRFLRAYIFRLGFLDGWPGYYIASHMAFATLVRYAKLREAALRDASKPR
jgi:glycosyltransferase involved in cell wall biosynthesis